MPTIRVGKKLNDRIRREKVRMNDKLELIIVCIMLDWKRCDK